MSSVMNNNAVSLPIYNTPNCELMEFGGNTMLSASPESGGLEDIQYDDWVVNTSANEV